MMGPGGDLETPRKLTLVKLQANLTGNNKKISIGPLDLPPGWITRVGIISSGGGSTASTMIHGRYFAKVDVTYGGQQHQTIWQGYCTVTALDSSPNIRVKRGDQVNFNVWCGTNGENGKQIIMGVWIEEDPNQVIGAGWIYDEKAGTGPGEMVTTSLPSPAGGADYAAITIGSSVFQKIRGFSGKLTTSAAVANRVPRIQCLDASGNLVSMGQATRNQPASLAVTHVGATGIFTSASGALGTGDLDFLSFGTEVRLEAGGQWKFATEALDGSDQWAAGFLYTEEWARPDP